MYLCVHHMSDACPGVGVTGCGKLPYVCAPEIRLRASVYQSSQFLTTELSLQTLKILVIMRRSKDNFPPDQTQVVG